MWYIPLLKTAHKCGRLDLYRNQIAMSFPPKDKKSFFPFTKFSPASSSSPASMHWVCCRHEAQTDFEVNNHYFLISWDEGTENPFSLPRETIRYPCNHLCHFSELTPVLPHLHFTSMSSSCSQPDPDSSLRNICWHLRPSLELILLF